MSKTLWDTEVCKENGVMTFLKVIVPTNLIMTKGCWVSGNGSAPKTEKLETGSMTTSSGVSLTKLEVLLYGPDIDLQIAKGLPGRLVSGPT